MDAIDILMIEHKEIKKVLAAIKKDCEDLAEGSEVDIQFYRNAIDFVRNFADSYHHRKEEKKLFNIMSEADERVGSGPVKGMLIEHDLGRAYIGNLKDALDDYEKGTPKRKAYIIANALSYVSLLENHIQKEDTAIYMAARRILSTKVQSSLAKEFEDIEADEDNKKMRKKYIDFANSF